MQELKLNHVMQVITFPTKDPSTTLRRKINKQKFREHVANFRTDLYLRSSDLDLRLRGETNSLLDDNKLASK